MRPIRWLPALILTLAVACAPAAAALAAGPGFAVWRGACTTSDPQGTCGPYVDRQISNNDGYNTSLPTTSGAAATRHAPKPSPQQRRVTGGSPNQAAGNTGVLTYPEVQQCSSTGAAPTGTTANMATSPISVLHQLGARSTRT